MRLFCFKDHSEPIEVERNLSFELIDAKAGLARLKRLPISAFTPRVQGGYITKHSVDRRDDAIATQAAEIAKLEILVKGVNL